MSKKESKNKPVPVPQKPKGKSKSITSKKKVKKKKVTPAKKATSVTPQVLTFPVKDLEIPVKWNRHKAPDLTGLISSIKAEGQLIPLLVRLREDGKTELVDGRCRTMALKSLKIKDAKVVYAEGEAKRDYLKSLVANFQRTQHNPVEMAEAFRDMKEIGLSHKDIVKSCGLKVESTISQHLAIFDLPGGMQRALRDGKMTIGHSRQLLRVNAEEDAAFQEKLFDKIISNFLPVTMAEEQAANYLEKKSLRAKKKKAAATTDKSKTPASTSAASKGATTPGEPEGKSKGGRKPAMTDYTDKDLVAEMKMISIPDIIEWLQSIEERRVKTKSPKKRERLQGRIDGLEIACGLQSE